MESVNQPTGLVAAGFFSFRAEIYVRKPNIKTAQFLRNPKIFAQKMESVNHAVSRMNTGMKAKVLSDDV